VIDRNNCYSPSAAAAEERPAATTQRQTRPVRLKDGLSRLNGSNNSSVSEVTVELHVTADEPVEPVPSSCGCYTDLSHHQFHQHHHPPTPHYHSNIDLFAFSSTDEVTDVEPANDLLSLGTSSLQTVVPTRPDPAQSLLLFWPYSTKLSAVYTSSLLQQLIASHG